jgi:DNA-binding response OmpR family regulator
MSDRHTNKGKEAEQTVLVVEDEPALSDIYATALRNGGFQVEQAYDGVEGLDKALHLRPKAILLDLLMPIKDGFDTLHDLKSHQDTSEIPVIILSNLGQDFERRRGQDLGAACFITKTELQPTRLGELIDSVLAGKGCHLPPPPDTK